MSFLNPSDSTPPAPRTPGTDPGEWTKRLNAVIPWGTSTCSKAPLYVPEEPSVIVRGRGCRVWDSEGREFIDYRNGLGPVTLGYGFPPVNAAITEQLEQGIVFGHPHSIECRVAEIFSQIVPCAGRVRFLKTGGEAVAACIRLARHHTGRDHVIQIGYNGWLNSLAGGARVLPNQTGSAVPAGVPAALSQFHHACPWNEEQGLERLFAEWPGQIAAVVVAADYARMAEGTTFYPFLRNLADRHGTLLIFDEIVTGFRVAMAGVQDYFTVQPDLAVFAKGVANGMPLSVYCGRSEIMDQLDKVIVSSTYGGEALSLAAAWATIQTYTENDVVGHLWRMGERLGQGLKRLFQDQKVPISVQGFWPCFVLSGDPEVLSRFFRSAYGQGVSLYNVIYTNFSHTEADIEETLERLQRALGEMMP